MKVAIGLGGTRKILAQNDFGDLSVVAPPSAHERMINQALRGLGYVDRDAAMLSIEPLRGELNLDPAGNDSFDSMIKFASTRGWLNSDETEVRAHITWL